MNQSGQPIGLSELLELSNYKRLGLPKKLIVSNIEKSYITNCYACYLDESKKELKGFVLWANVDSNTLRQLRDFSTFPRYPYEWDEGNFTLFIDVVFSDSLMMKHRGIFREILKSRGKFLSYFRRGTLKIRKNPCYRNAKAAV